MEKVERPLSQFVEDLPSDEKGGEEGGEKGTASDVESGERGGLKLKNDNLGTLKGVLKFGVERRGILPVPIDQRVDPNYNKIFFIFFSANFNILSFSQGTLGPAIYGLGLRDSALVILFFNVLCCILPAYLATWGPKLGMRQMCQARYSFGYFGAIVPSVLNLTTFMGFLILNCILGGSTLASVTGGGLSWNVGIVIIALLSLFISFCGYKVINVYEKVAWFPVLIVYLVLLGVGGKHLKEAPPPAAPATVGTILSFASVIAGFVVSYAGLMTDFTAYFKPEVSSFKIFLYTYIGFLLPIVPLQILGAAFAAAAPAIPAWSAAYEGGNVGGLIEEILTASTGNFGKFLTVLMALSVTANTSPTIYSFCLSFQVFVPWLAVLPRYVFSVVAFAIMTPIAIVGAHRFYDTLVNFTGIIGYWASAFGAVVIVEHLYFRRNRFIETISNGTSPAVPHVDSEANRRESPSTDPDVEANVRAVPASAPAYDLTVWNTPSKLPPGIAALLASVLAFGLVIPSMDQVWFVGPFAQRIGGDIGFEMAFAATAVFYVPLRYFERWFFKR